MQRWSRKKPPFPLLASLFCVFLVATILYNENNRQFHVEREAASAYPSFPTTSLPLNISAHRTKRADVGGYFLFVNFYFIYLFIGNSVCSSFMYCFVYFDFWYSLIGGFLLGVMWILKYLICTVGVWFSDWNH